MIKLVIFDLYGTIMTSKEGKEPKDEALSRILREAGYDIYFQEMLAARQFVGFIDYTRGRANTPQEYYARVMERLEISPNPSLVGKLTSEDAEEKNVLYPDVAPTVTSLKSRGIKTAIVTAIAAWRFEPLLKQNNVEIDFICTAREAKAVKPNPKIYAAVLDKFGVRANETIMVGDDIKTDIEPAKKLGMRTALLSRREKVKRGAADKVISSLVELLDWISAENKRRTVKTR